MSLFDHSLLQPLTQVILLVGTGAACRILGILTDAGVQLVVLGLAMILGLRGIVAAIIVIQSAVPASVTATVMAQEYGADAGLAATTGAFFRSSCRRLPFHIVVAVVATL